MLYAMQYRLSIGYNDKHSLNLCLMSAVETSVLY